MIGPEFHFHRPNVFKRLGERLGVYEVTPADIVPKEELDNLLRTYTDLAGDQDIGPGNDGSCQSWRGYPYWWKELALE